MVSEAAVHPAVESLVELHHGSQEAESSVIMLAFLFFSSFQSGVLSPWMVPSVSSVDLLPSINPF